MAKFDMREWAVRGAEQRLREMTEETRAILAAFPELRGRRGPASTSRIVAAESETDRPTGRRRKRSAAARKRMSDAQKARWARQKAGAAGGEAPAVTRSVPGRAAKKK